MRTPTLLSLLLLSFPASGVAGPSTQAQAQVGSAKRASGDSVAMPAAPAGMRELSSEEREALLRELSPEAPGDPEDSRQIEEQSAELESLRALEETAIAPANRAEAERRAVLRGLGAASPLRRSLDCAEDEDDLFDALAAPPVEGIVSSMDVDVTLAREQFDIPVEVRPAVVQWVRFFQGGGRKWFRKWMSRSTRFLPVMQPILEQRGIPKDTVYLAMIESGFSSKAYSWAHAAGPWQFIPATGSLYGLKQNFWVDERRDPIKSTHAAARFLGHLRRDLGDWYLAWAGYNAGGGRLRRLVNQHGTTDFWALSEAGGMAKETRHYVPKIIAAALISKSPASFGFRPEEFDFERPLEFDEVQLDHPVALDAAARAAGVPLDDVKELNPELKRWCTPPASAASPYALRLPKGTGERFEQNHARAGSAERLAFRVHRVKKGETLSRIASAYKSAPESILRLNGLTSGRRLKLNSELVIPVAGAAAVRSGRGESVLASYAAHARRAGYVATRVDEEIPAGPAESAKRPSSGKSSLAAKAKSAPTREVVKGKVRITYGVQSGDSLWGISQRYNCSVDDLRKWNKLSGRASLRAGMRLVIWPNERTASASTRG